MNPFEKMRKIVSTYMYYAGYIERKFCSIAPYLGFVPKANTLGRKPGISALVLLRNEPWVEPSLLSIKDFVDEIVIVDSSTDDTPKKVRRIADEHGLNIKYVHTKPNYRKQLEIAIKMSTREWLLKWDGDFIAYLSGKRDIRRLKNVIEKFPKKKYCFIEICVLNVDLDLLHVSEDPYYSEAYIFRYSPFLLRRRSYPRWKPYFTKSLWYGMVDVRLPLRAPYLPFPRWYEKIILKEVHMMHLRSVKSPLKMLERRYDDFWALMEPGEKSKYSNSYEKYVQFCVKRDFNKDMNEAAEELIQRLKRKWKLIPFNKEVHGDYPIILKKMIKETLKTEIEETEEFREKLMHYLLSSPS